MAKFIHDEIYPAKLASAEQSAIRVRRFVANNNPGWQKHENCTEPCCEVGEPEQCPQQEHRSCTAEECKLGKGEECPKRPPIGLALSGGGIRSATFALGVIQSLAKHKILPRIDYMSTVSGGGFTGAFLGRLFTWLSKDTVDKFIDGLRAQPGSNNHDVLEKNAPSNSEIVHWVLTNPASPPLDWLRENGRYLSPNGSGDTLLGIAIALRNWFAARLPFWTFMLTFFVVINFVRAIIYADIGFWSGDEDPMLKWHLWWSPALYIFVPLVLIMVVIGWAYWLVPIYNRKNHGYYLIRAHVLLIVGLLVAPALYPSLVGVSTTALGICLIFVVIATIAHLVFRRDGLKWAVRLLLLLFAVWLAALMLPLDAKSYPSSFQGLPADLLTDFRTGALPKLMFAKEGEILIPKYKWQGLVILGIYFVSGSWAIQQLWLSESTRRDISNVNALRGWQVAIGLVVCIGPMVGIGYFISDSIELRWSDLLCFTVLVALISSAIPSEWDRTQQCLCGIGCHTLLIVIGVALGVIPFAVPGIDNSHVCHLLALFVALALGFAFVASAVSQPFTHHSRKHAYFGSVEEVRHDLSVWLRNFMIMAIIAGCFVLVDTCGQTLYAIQRAAVAADKPGFMVLGTALLLAIGSIVAVVAGAQKLVMNLIGSETAGRIRPGWRLIVLLVSCTLLSAELIAINLIGHTIAWSGNVPSKNPGAAVAPSLVGVTSTDTGADAGDTTSELLISINPFGQVIALPVGFPKESSAKVITTAPKMSLNDLFVAVAVLALLTWLIGRQWRLVNLSTFNPLYASRLTRAYLGASNPERWAGEHRSVTQVAPGDIASLGEYLPNRQGGPLHLINITINETTSGRSQIEQRDRKGLSLAFGPCGASVHTDYHAIWVDGATGLDMSNLLYAEPRTLAKLTELRDNFHSYRIEQRKRKSREIRETLVWYFGILRRHRTSGSCCSCCSACCNRDKRSSFVVPSSYIPFRDAVRRYWIADRAYRRAPKSESHAIGAYVVASQKAIESNEDARRKYVFPPTELQIAAQQAHRTRRNQADEKRQETLEEVRRTRKMRDSAGEEVVSAVDIVREEILRMQQERTLELVPVSPPQNDRFRVFEVQGKKNRKFKRETIECEEIPVSAAMTISGAAFTTGLGARTSFATSLLCGMLNIRLGYWWDSGVEPKTRKKRIKPDSLSRFGGFVTEAFPVQATLLQELTARFHGSARRWWYLSDGGHYENLGAYELIRRKVPWIIISDAECDPDYKYDGLAKLVRTARIDFGAEISFLSDNELDLLIGGQQRSNFGSPTRLRRGRRVNEAAADSSPNKKRGRVFVEPDRENESLCHAAIAWVRYPGTNGELEKTPRSILIYLKPTLTGDEPEDVRQYHAENPDFPHETTMDQYFNEAQWESYRCLGQHIGECVFKDADQAGAESPGNWLTGGRSTPQLLDEFVARFRTAAPDSIKHLPSDANWRVFKFESNGKQYLSIQNLAFSELTYGMGQWDEVKDFRNGILVEPVPEKYWKTAPLDLPVGPRGRVLIQKP